MKNEGNALAGDVSVGKQQIADAITKKGVPTKSTDSYRQDEREYREDIRELTMIRLQFSSTLLTRCPKFSASARLPSRTGWRKVCRI